MRLFKYLVFIFISLFSASSFAALYWHSGANASNRHDSPERACLVYGGSSFTYYPDYIPGGGGNFNIGHCTYGSQTVRIFSDSAPAPKECNHPSTVQVPVTIDGDTLKYASSFCGTSTGVNCSYIPVKPVKFRCAPSVGGAPCYATHMTYQSVSSTPASSCADFDLITGCNFKDPYGGCYTPPNQECTRQHDGSIVCPEEKEPVIEEGCNGADYCKRPPQGCGVGYVSGNYNGDRVCIKSSKPSEENIPVDPNNPDPVDPNKSVTDSVKDLKDTFEHYLKETVQSIDALSKNPLGDSPVNVTANVEVDIDLSETNAKIDETNGILDEIKEWLFEDVNESDLEADMPSDIELSKRSFSQTIFGSQTSCPSDRTLSMTLFTGKAFSYDFSFQMFCEKLEILGYLILIFAYYQAVMIVVRSA